MQTPLTTSLGGGIQPGADPTRQIPPPQVKDRVTARPRHLTPGLEGLMADDNGAKGGAGEALVAHTQ